MSASPSRHSPAASGLASRPLLLLVLVVAAAGAAWWILRDEAGDASVGELPAVAAGEAPEVERPEAPVPERAELDADEADLAPAESTDEHAGVEGVPDDPRTVEGRVVLEGPGAIPGGLEVVARYAVPSPRVTRFSMQGVFDRPRAFRRVTGVSAAELEGRTAATVGTDGRFTMHGVPATGAWLAVRDDRYYVHTPTSVEPAEPLDDEIELPIRQGATIAGRVLGPGGPIAGVDVEARSQVDPYTFLEGFEMAEVDGAPTDEDGRFVLSPVPTGIALSVRTTAHGRLRAGGVDVPALPPGVRHEVELHLEPGATIEVFARDESQAALADARILLMPSVLSMKDLDAAGKPRRRELRTGDDGRAVFETVAPGAYRVRLATSGYLVDGTESFEVAAGQVVDDIVVTGRRGAHLAGRIVDAEGEPVPGASVQAALRPSLTNMQFNMDREMREEIELDDDGAFDLGGYDPEAELRLWISAPGFVHTHVDAPAGTTDLVVTLERKMSISGIAVGLGDGEPLTAYTIRLAPSGGLFDMSKLLEMDERIRNMRPPEHVRDAEGRFLVDEVAPGLYDLTLTAEGYARTVVEKIALEPEEPVSGLVVMVPEEGRVTGRVVSGRTAEPVPDVTVTVGKTDLLATYTEVLAGSPPKTTTAGDGTFDLGGLGAEPVTLSFQHRAYRTHSLPSVVVAPGEVMDLGVVALPTGATLHGELLDADARPREGVTVLATNSMGTQMRRARSGADGAWRIEGLTPGSYNVMLMDSFTIDSEATNPAAFLEDMVYRTVTVAENETKRVDLSAASLDGCRLEGTVRSAEGVEAGATLWILREDGETRMRFAASGDDGHYAFDGLEPGRYLLQVMPSDEVTMGSGSQPAAPVSSTVVIGSGPVQRHDVHVPGGVLEGEVRDARDGRRLGGVRIVLERTDEGRAESRFLEASGGRVGETYTDDQGRFRFGHLASGSYAVVAGGQNILGLGTGGYAQERIPDVTVRDGSPGFRLDIDLDRGGGVTGLVTDTGEAPLSGVPIWLRDDRTGEWLSLVSETTTDGAGRYEVNSLEPGPWTLAFGGNRRALTLVQGVAVRRDALEEVDVELERGVEVLVDPSPYAANELAVVVTGPAGAVPAHLVSVDRLLSAPGGGATLRVGRFPAGAYDVTVLHAGQELVRSRVTLSRQEATRTLVIEDELEGAGE